MVNHELIQGNSERSRSESLHDNNLSAGKSNWKHPSDKPQSAPVLPWSVTLYVNIKMYFKIIFCSGILLE